MMFREIYVSLRFHCVGSEKGIKIPYSSRAILYLLRPVYKLDLLKVLCQPANVPLTHLDHIQHPLAN